MCWFSSDGLWDTLFLGAYIFAVFMSFSLSLFLSLIVNLAGLMGFIKD